MRISDFSEEETRRVASLLLKRYGKEVELELADSELQLGAGALVTCPTLCWDERGAQFAVFKVGDSRFRSLFLYSAGEQYGTGREEYDDLENCVTTLLRVQADHELRNH